MWVCKSPCGYENTNVGGIMQVWARSFPDQISFVSGSYSIFFVWLLFFGDWRNRETLCTDETFFPRLGHILAHWCNKQLLCGKGKSKRFVGFPFLRLLDLDPVVFSQRTILHNAVISIGHSTCLGNHLFSYSCLQRSLFIMVMPLSLSPSLVIVRMKTDVLHQDRQSE